MLFEDLQSVVHEGAALGLFLNERKCEVICIETGLISGPPSVTSLIPGAQLIQSGCATLLGSSIGDTASISDILSSKTQILHDMGERLHYFSSQDAFLLLKNSFSIPKVLHLLRSAPTFLSAGLVAYDKEQRSILESIANVQLDNRAWSQASLPVKDGGLGVRSAVDLAPSAYLSSTSATRDLVLQILPLRLRSVPVPFKSVAMSLWSAGTNMPPPVDTDAYLQKSWDRCKIDKLSTDLLESAPDASSRARLLAVSAPESGAWLNTLPISSLGLKMDDNAVRVAMGLRLGVPLCRPHPCHHCGKEVSHMGVHGLSCRFSQGRHHRHGALNQIIHRALTAIHIPSQLEPVGLSRSDGKRPDGASVVPWERGRLLVWDVTCPDTLAPSYLSVASSGVGEVASAAETRKLLKYQHLDCHFAPIAIETMGTYGSRTLTFLKELGRRMSRCLLERNSYVYLTQRLSVAVQRGNAASVLGTAVENYFVL